MKNFIIAILSLSLFAATCSADILPAGTEIKVKLAEPVKSQIRRVGYQVKMTVTGDLIINEKVAIKDGAKAFAKISKIKAATRNSEAEIELTLTQLNINRKPFKVNSHPVGGKGQLQYSKELGTKNLDQDEMISSLGTPIANSIPVVDAGNYVEINKDTTIYFITTQDINY